MSHRRFAMGMGDAPINPIGAVAMGTTQRAGKGNDNCNKPTGQPGQSAADTNSATPLAPLAACARMHEISRAAPLEGARPPRRRVAAGQAAAAPRLGR